MTLAERYRQMPRAELLRIAQDEAGDLAPEAMAALDAELAARDLYPREPASAGAGALTRREAEDLARAIMRRPCPVCKRRRPVNAGTIAETRGLLITAKYKETVLVACAACRASRARRALLKTAVLGWWALPAGPILTVGSLWQTAQTLRECENRRKPTQTLLTYLAANPAHARALAGKTPAAPPGPLAPEATGSSPSGASSTAAARSGRPSEGG